MRYIILLMFLLIYTFSIGQIKVEKNAIDSTELIIELANDKIRIGEPIYYTITLKNSSTSDINIIKPWIKGNFPELQYKQKKDSLWHSLPISSLSGGNHYGVTIEKSDIVTRLKPEQTISKTLVWLDIPFIINGTLRPNFGYNELYETDKIVSDTGGIKLRIFDDMLYHYSNKKRY